MIKKVLIANRGEIAIRIAKTCKYLGIKTVGIYSKDDSMSLHLNYCDETSYLGEDPLKGSYLNIDKIISIAKKYSVNAIHPGYGFLSENPKFVKMLEKEKIIFVGPSFKSIELMGDKIQSKKIAREAGVNCIPGYEEAIVNIKQGIKFANEIGYPVMIKASAGGGGKGMRIAYNNDEFESLVIAAKNEAMNAFGDDRVFIEKYIEKPRHIEMQILGDKFGNLVWLGERECSVQRRHQKIIEEAPSSFIDKKTREEMGKQSLKLAKKVNYYSAGTVEFVVDQNKNFYFLEMNTRLQVEHPVTELVTGIDLVEQMFNIAANKRLEITQNKISFNGWSFESRICAENPKNNFLPSAGRIESFSFPKKNIRVDYGYISGGEVSIYYDSLIAKVISFGKNRLEAIDAMKKALSETAIKGIDSNINFLMDIYKKDSFKKGKITTNFINEVYKNSYLGEIKDKFELEIIVYLAFSFYISYLVKVNKDINNISKLWIVKENNNNKIIEVIELTHNTINLKLDNKEKFITYSINYEESIAKVSYKGTLYAGVITQSLKGIRVDHNGSDTLIQVYTKRASELLDLLPKEKKSDKENKVFSPMPGKVTKLLVKESDKVESGDNLLVLDAMKMENILKADSSGKVKTIHVKQGDAVLSDQILITLD